MLREVLLVEDEPNIAAFIKKGLEELDFNVMVAYNGETAMDLVSQKDFHIVILDVILPDFSGLEVCRRMRNMGFREIPVLMLTALGTTDNIVNGLGAGADDYLIKPFKFKELVARLEALLRRKNLTADFGQTLQMADLKLDRDSKTASRSGTEIKLTSTEYRLLEYFLKNRNKVLSRMDILENVWDISFNMGTNVVDVYVNYLRNKIDKGFERKLIHTVIGMGYIIKDQGDSYENQK